MSLVGYQSDFISPGGNQNTNNAEDLSLFIEQEHIGSDIIHTPNRNRYIVTENNIVISADIRLKLTGNVTGKLPSYPVLALPIPKSFERIVSYPGSVFSNTENIFSYRMGTNGLVAFSGELTGVNEEIIFNFKPYIAEFPLRFTPLP